MISQVKNFRGQCKWGRVYNFHDLNLNDGFCQPTGRWPPLFSHKIFDCCQFLDDIIPIANADDFPVLFFSERIKVMTYGPDGEGLGGRLHKGAKTQ